MSGLRVDLQISLADPFLSLKMMLLLTLNVSTASAMTIAPPPVSITAWDFLFLIFATSCIYVAYPILFSKYYILSIVASGVSAECLRSIEVEDLLDAMPAEWRPTTPDLPAPVGPTGMPSPHQWLVLDGDILRSHPSEVWDKWETEGNSLQIVFGG